MTQVEQPALMSVEDVGVELKCSPRNVYRLSDAGKMPRPIKLGRLVRWSRCELMEWIANGCPSPRKTGGR